MPRLVPIAFRGCSDLFQRPEKPYRWPGSRSIDSTSTHPSHFIPPLSRRSNTSREPGIQLHMAGRDPIGPDAWKKWRDGSSGPSSLRRRVRPGAQ
jgi:hypothetical protein